MIHLQDVNKTYYGAQPLHVLKGINLDIEAGEFVSIMGASGSGKSTLLNILGILDNYDSGLYELAGVRIWNLSERKAAEYRNKMIGFIFQSFNLIAFKTAVENVELPLFYQGVSRKKRHQLALEYLERLGLLDWATHYPNELSGGQRQRVAFARALAPNPQVLLLDEPFGAIDAKIRKELRSWLREIVTQLHITSLFVTHDQEEAFEVSDRVIIMSNGRIEQIGAPAEIYSKPETGFVARFAGNAPIVEDYGRFNGFEKTRPGSVAVVRPECVEAFRVDNPEFADVLPFAQPCVLEDISFRGFYRELTLNVDGVRINAHRGMGRRSQLDVGESMMCYIDRLYVVDDESNEVEILENSLLP